MRHDKKNQGDKINFTLLNAIGESKIDYLLDEEQIVEALIKVFILS